MEEGSLLPEALRHMERQRQLEDDAFNSFVSNVRDCESSSANVNGSLDGADLSSGGGSTALVHNALVVSIYLLDGDSSTKLIGGDTNTSEEERRDALESIANLGIKINNVVLPELRQLMPYPWHVGGEALVFGAHCGNGEDRRGPDKCLPHLRATLRYGHSLNDQWFAVALMYRVADILSKAHGQKVAIEFIDVDDGNFLLIEAADALPKWVDEVGFEGMSNRTWLEEGYIHIIPVNVRSLSGDMSLSKEEALCALVDETTYTKAPSGVQEAIHNRIQHFVASLQPTGVIGSSATQDWLHRAAVVLPLNLAVLFRSQPDLIPSCVHAFCRCEGRQHQNFQIPLGDRKPQPSLHPPIRFERLVKTVVTLSRTTYALLLTGEGMVPPPFAIPKEYRSVELNRTRRHLKNEALTDRFRHAIEGGIRLTRGFEHLVNGNRGKKSTSAELNFGDKENRVCCHWTRLDIEMGGGGTWITDSWRAGPTIAAKASCINAFTKCPVYRPELSQGGQWPLSHPQKSSAQLASDALRAAAKSSLNEQDFPTMREDQVDGDKWVDLITAKSADAALAKIMSSRQGKNLNRETTYDSAKEGIHSVNAMFEGLQAFVERSSGVEGVKTRGFTSKRLLFAELSQEDANAILEAKSETVIDSDVFLNALQNSLKIATRTRTSNDDLDSFFYEDDYGNQDADSISDELGDGTYECKGEGPASMKDVMMAMDAELSGTKVERVRQLADRDGVAGNDGSESEIAQIVSTLDDDMMVDVDIISNLLKSLHAQGGGPGPLSNVLKDLGLDPPS